METSPLLAHSSEAWAEQFSVALRAQRDRARQFLATQQKRLDQAETFVEQELQRLEKELGHERGEADRLRIACDELTARLSQTESQLAEAEKHRADVPEDQAWRNAENDLRQRCEQALEELRQARNKNAELQQELCKSRSAAKLIEQAQPPGWFDWEAEKRRILAALETDVDPNDKSQRADRSKIAEMLRTTDEVVAAKNREIQELKQQLEGPACDCAAGISDVAAINRALNNDAVVREERERLKRMQEEWGEKLRQAEVELSLERAKIARQRADMEQQGRANTNPPAEPCQTAADGQTERAAGGRWMARFGLSDADREPRRHL